jgi:AraC-like DNA-binding protein
MEKRSGNQGTIHFSSGALRKQSRLTTLREKIGRKITNTELVPLNDDFRLDLTLQMPPGLSIMRGSSTPFRFVGPVNPARANDDLLFMWAEDQSEMRWSQCGGDIHLRDGIATMMGADVLRIGENARTASYTTLSLERARLAPLIGNLDGARMRPVSADAEPLRLLKHYLNGLSDTLSAAMTETIVTHIYDLVALAVGTTRDAGDLTSRRGLRLARLNAARKLIRANLWDQSYCIKDAARKLGLSPRTVQMLFQEEGTTFTAFLLAQRLAAVHSQLSKGHKATSSISTIAFESGFGDLSHFNHAFRRAYGETPSDVRARAETVPR